LGYATVAQSVEQLIRNQQVAGSSPASSSSGKLPLPSRTPHNVGCVLFCACTGMGIYFVNASQIESEHELRLDSFLLGVKRLR
jgi:hypothetical protein